MNEEQETFEYRIIWTRPTGQKITYDLEIPIELKPSVLKLFEHDIIDELNQKEDFAKAQELIRKYKKN